MKVLKIKFLSIFVVILLTCKVQCDFYTSIVSLEELLYAEEQLIGNLESYLMRREHNNNEILKFLKEFEEINKVIEEDPDDYLENPINAFKLITRVVRDWKQVENMVLSNHEVDAYVQNLTKLEQENANPVNTDLQGAVKGLLRLQKTYKLQTEEVANGEILDYELSDALSASDCFYMGRTLYEEKEYRYAAQWLIQSILALENELQASNNTYSFPYVTEVQIMEYLAPVYYYLGNMKMALKLNNELLAVDPNNKYGLQNKVLYEEQAILQRRMWANTNADVQEPTPSKVNDLYERICREELEQTPAKKRNLRCRYVSNNVPFCLLAPLKLEELNDEPFVGFYYNVLYEPEIAFILNATETSIERSTVGDRNISQTSDVRTSQNTWLDVQEHSFLKHLKQRLLDMTGLSMENSEPMQIANYGIGGHYAPHYDFMDFPEITFPGRGNRIMTAIFYMNDVELGGATAFPFLHLGVPAVKGGMVYWYNMHGSLEPDYRTKHAGCPVLKGSKWICNEWFHAVGQEFKKPCGLENNGEISLRYKTIV